MANTDEIETIRTNIHETLVNLVAELDKVADAEIQIMTLEREIRQKSRVGDTTKEAEEKLFATRTNLIKSNARIAQLRASAEANGQLLTWQQLRYVYPVVNDEPITGPLMH